VMNGGSSKLVVGASAARRTFERTPGGFIKREKTATNQPIRNFKNKFNQKRQVALWPLPVLFCISNSHKPNKNKRAHHVGRLPQ